MTRIAFDSDNPAALPAGAQIVLTYSDLIKDEPAYGLLSRAHEGRPVVLIDRGLGDPTGLASVIDVETGAHKIGDIPGWLDAKAKADVAYRTVYVDRSNYLAAKAAIASRTGYYWWIATLDGTAHVDTFRPGEGPALVQCLSAEMLGFGCDASVVWDDAWQPAPAKGRAGQLLEELHKAEADIHNGLTDLAFRLGELS